jgi:cytochrome P450 family 12
MRNDFGKILKFKGTFGRRDILMITSPEDYETLFRREPAWPRRRGMDVFVHYRKNMRKDVFKGVGGLLTE